VLGFTLTLGQSGVATLAIVIYNAFSNIAVKNIIKPLPFWHKLNYFLFWRNFEKIFIIYVEIIIK
jgi:hypothetical protein